MTLAIDSATGEKLVQTMRGIMNVPYLWGGKNPAQGVDCSGAVSWCMAQCGIVPDKWGHQHNAEDIKNYCEGVAYADVQPGDLVFFGSPTHINHVMMLTENQDEIIGAAGGGPSCTSVNAALAHDARVKVMPLTYRRDLVCYGRPVWLS